VTSQRDTRSLHTAELGVTGGAKDGGSLDSAVNAVVAAWTAKGAMSPRTLDKFAQQARRFTRFAAARDVTTLSGTDSELVAKFVGGESLSGRRGAVPTAPSAGTVRNRRAAVRAFFRTAQELGLSLNDPTVEIAVVGREDASAPTVRPLDDDEAALMQRFSRHDTPTRHAATVALLLAGAHTSEVGRIRIRDVDTAAHSVWAPGSSRHRSRRLFLDTWARRVVYERIEHLTERGATANDSVCTRAGGSDVKLQARVCGTVREIFDRAGLAETPDVAPSSLTAYAGRRKFDETGRIEEAARVTGFDSLDGTAEFIGYQWRPVPAGSDVARGAPPS
jgi:integrase